MTRYTLSINFDDLLFCFLADGILNLHIKFYHKKAIYINRKISIISKINIFFEFRSLSKILELENYVADSQAS